MRSRMSKLGCLVLMYFAGSAFGLSAHAEEYPTKPVQLIVNMRVGGIVDTLARGLAQELGNYLGQPIVVESKGGADGLLGLRSLKQSPSDGYTLLMSPSSVFVLVPLQREVDYSLKDFKFIATVSEFQLAFVTSPSKPWKTFKELVEYAKTNPGVTYASISATEKALLRYIGKQEGIDWNAVPFKGGSAARAAILGGHVDFGFSAGGHTPLVEAGKLTILAQLGEQRLENLPEVPTLKELGYPVFARSINVVAAPAGLAEPIVTRLTEAFEKAAKDPHYIDLLKKFQVPGSFLGAAETEDALERQITFYREMLEVMKD